MTTFTSMHRKKHALIKDLAKFSGLDENLVERIILTSECLVFNECGCISETTFLSQMMQHFDLTDRFIISQIFDSMLPLRAVKKGLSPEEHSRLLCTFLSKDTDLKINFVYRVYDMDRDGVISKYEITNMLKFAVPQDDDQEDVLKDLVELVMKAIDIDHNGSIDIHEFKTLIKKDVLYTEILGRCLPEEGHADKFRDMLLNTSIPDLKEMFRGDYSLTILKKLIPTKAPTYYPFPLDFEMN